MGSAAQTKMVGLVVCFLLQEDLGCAHHDGVLDLRLRLKHVLVEHTEELLRVLVFLQSGQQGMLQQRTCSGKTHGRIPKIRVSLLNTAYDFEPGLMFFISQGLS